MWVYMYVCVREKGFVLWFSRFRFRFKKFKTQGKLKYFFVII